MSVVNANLISARRARNDEFYTRYEDVESECRNYEAAFRGARVLCNSDDPSRSAFWAYFHRNFARLGLRRLSATYLSGPRAATLSVYEGGDDNYDAVDAGRVADVPDGYAGVMGVPVTFLTRWNPEQFDVVVFRRGVDGEVSAFSRDRERAFNRAFRAVVEGAWAAGGMTADERGFADVVRARPDLVEAALAAREPVEVYFRFETDGAHKMRLRGREPFKRLLIRRRD